MGVLLLEKSSKRIIENAENQLSHSGEIIEIQFQEYVDELISDVLFLSGSPVLNQYLKADSKGNIQLLNEEFFSMVTSNGDYAQIRYIDAGSGDEIVRVEQKESGPIIIPFDQLQNKKSRPYFINSIQLDHSKYYLSPINLNREFGSISIPYTPTLRIAKPIFLEKKLKGIVVINTDLTKLFDKLSKSVGGDFNLRILNENGQYLLHEEKDSTFLFEFNVDRSQVNLQEDKYQNSLIHQNDEMISNHKMDIGAINYSIVYHIVANRSKLLKSYFEWRAQSIYLILAFTLICAGLAFFVLRRQSKNLKRLTTNMKEFPSKRKVSELPLHRKDEIGDLARSLENMAGIINIQMDSIEAEKLKAETAERDKSNFIENISHEIRNPLQSIIGLSKLLEQNNPNPNQLDIIKSIRLNSANLKDLVTSILDYQQVLKGMVQVENDWTDLPQLIQELITGVRYSAIEKNIHVHALGLDELGQIETKIDRLRISQILNNIISNAITHTPSKGEVTVKVKHSIKDDSICALRFSIIDNGVGMSQKEMDEIKNRYFTTADNTLISSNFGLGLTIVHELLNMMGSELEIESQKNEGSVFSFVVESEYRSKVNKENLVSFDSGIVKDSKILVIEDDIQIINLYSYYFEEHTTQYIRSFSEVEQLDSTDFDVIISDFKLKDGILTEQLDRVKKVTHQNSNLVVVSGDRVDLMDIETYFPCAVAVQKPVSKESLYFAIFTGSVWLKFGKPYLESILKDYDYNQEKYQKAVLLLLNEWQIYKVRLEETIKTNNKPEFEEILHKLNNTLRRLRLDGLENELVGLKDQFEQNKDWKHESRHVSAIMEVYFRFIQNTIS
ncbi:MAG: ATP-binding protein [Saprospiraceae bacterium]|nr:ATP-binding protein [Saprospiraceae bacterium]